MINDKQHRILVVAPTGRDAHLLCDVLGNNGLTYESCTGVGQLCEELRDGVGAILLSEEALISGALENLSNALGAQPRWSDVPVVLLTSNVQRIDGIARQMFRQKGARSNLLIVEKPVRPLSLLSTVDAALMARMRQYELRDYLDERQRAEAALRESEERYRLLVDGVKDYAIFMVDAEGRVRTWNKGAQRLKGYRAEEIIGEHFSRFYPAEDIERGKPELELKLAAAEGRCEDEGWRIRKDGTRFFANVVITALTDEAGRVRGFSKMTRDITERRRAEESVRRSEAHLAESQEISHTGSWTWNVSSGELFWSKEHFRIFGLDPENVKPTRKNTQKLIHPEDRSFVEQTLDRAIRERSDFELDYRIVRSDGAIRYHHGWGHPRFNESGSLEFIGSVMDVTERKHAAEKAEAADAAKRSQELKSAFLDALAHEIKSPLTAGRVAVTTLLGNSERLSIDERRELLDIIDRNLNRLNTWSSETIQAASIEAGTLTLKRERQDIGNMIRHIIDEWAKDFQDTRLVLNIPDVPRQVEVDHDMINYVLRLLLGNAVKYSPASSPVEISCQYENEAPIVSVRDFGPGIPLDEQELIFEKYYRGRTNVEIPGAGLGLAIARSIIRAHGGNLWVISAPGHGSDFRFSLPCARE